MVRNAGSLSDLTSNSSGMTRKLRAVRSIHESSDSSASRGGTSVVA
jgi:hypothetical protein